MENSMKFVYRTAVVPAAGGQAIEKTVLSQGTDISAAMVAAITAAIAAQPGSTGLGANLVGQISYDFSDAGVGAITVFNVQLQPNPVSQQIVPSGQFWVLAKCASATPTVQPIIRAITSLSETGAVLGINQTAVVDIDTTV
jgi:hypothetical protein